MPNIKSKLHLFNSKEHKKQEFQSIEAYKVKIYVCGPTLYDDPHIGNFRPIIVFDLLYRILILMGYKVNYVRNITDIDDKIIARAERDNISVSDLVQSVRARYNSTLMQLNILSPSKEPLATDHILDMQQIILTLIEKGYAYESKGTVLFNTEKFKTYGLLSNKNLTELQTKVDELTKDHKVNSNDFVMWKPAKKNEPFWASPWGNGRPGWHIECSAMAKHFLGPVLDIHGGGSDLIFPHHENERAQTMAACNTAFMAKYWMHNAFVNTNDYKMSKSLGNMVTPQQVCEHYSYTSLRLAMLMTHYRHELNYKESIIKQANIILNKINKSLAKVKSFDTESYCHNQDFIAALMDDLNTSLAVTVLQTMVTQLNKVNDEKQQSLLGSQILLACDLFGILSKEQTIFFLKSNINLSKLCPFMMNTLSSQDIESVHNINNIPSVLADSNSGYVAEFRGKELILYKESNAYKQNINLVNILYTISNSLKNTVYLERLQGYNQKFLTIDSLIDIFINIRSDAKLTKDYLFSDLIRDKLLSVGIILEDLKETTSWKRVSK